MFLTNKAGSLTDAAATRTAALEQTYYNRNNHPEVIETTIWTGENIFEGTAAITESSGVLKTAIDEVIALVASRDLGTVDNYMAYCQYYKQSATEPNVHYDVPTGYEPDYIPDLIGIVYLHDVDGNIEFYKDFTSEYTDGTKASQFALDTSYILQNNMCIIFDHSLPHRIAPAVFGTDKTDSGLMLAIFMKLQ